MIQLKRLYIVSMLGLFLICFICAASDIAEAKSWWEELGEPQYGGTISFAIGGQEFTSFDPYNGMLDWPWYEPMFEPDWTVDRDKWSMQGFFVPDQYWAGHLAESWEITNPQSITVHLRKGIMWQNKPPVNGREFTANDLQAHYNRILGTGEGDTKPAPWVGALAPNLDKVTATDRYTVVYKFKNPTGQGFQCIADRNSLNVIEPPEWAALSREDQNDWRSAAGTGPWILADYVVGSSMSYIKNPIYWGKDPRYPDNRLPYADKLVNTIISDSATRIAALRTGKIDILAAGNTRLPWQQMQTLKRSNPELRFVKVPINAQGVSFRIDRKPFEDIRVRKALQKAINRKEIANSFYGGYAEEVPSGLITRSYKGYAFRYEDWPQALKDEYAYNPAASKKLLAEAGYPDGFKTNVIASSIDDLELLQIFKSYFSDIGVDMEIRTMDPAAFGAFRRAGKHDQMVTDACAFPGPPSRLIDHFFSKNPMNAAMVKDSGYDALNAKFWATIDTTESAKVFMEEDQYVIEHHWWVLAGECYGFYSWQPYLKGYSAELLQLPGIIFSRCWVDQNLKK